MSGFELSGLEWIDQTEQMRIRQKVEWTEVFSGFQMGNRYTIDDGHERFVLRAGEVSKGIGGFFWRQFLKRKRPFLVQVFNSAQNVVLEVVRPWRWFFSRAEVRDGRGQAVGAIQQKWAFFRRHYVLEDPQGRTLADLSGPFFRPWTFEILQRGVKNGYIRKKWSGLGKEAFTSADNFTVEMGPGLDRTQRTLCLAATILIDFVHFETK